MPNSNPTVTNLENTGDGEDSLVEKRYRARWVPGLFGRTPELPARQWRFLALMVAASFFNAYDGSIFSLALNQIQAGLTIDENQLGTLGAVVRLGVVPGAILAFFADQLGRRRLLLWTIVGYTVCTALTAFSPDEHSFVVLQFFARGFGTAEAILAGVVIAEEIDADQRGWALGVLASLAALGGGLALLLFAFVDLLPFGWRSLYLVGIIPLTFIALLRRNLPETRRFTTYKASIDSVSRDSVVKPLILLLRMYPWRFAAIAAVLFLMSYSGQAAGFFFPKFMQDTHGWKPSQFAMFGVMLGLIGLCATPLFGRLGDRWGRKRTAVFFIICNPLAVIALFNTGFAFLLPVLWLAMMLSDAGSDINLSAVGKELFPTSHRSTAVGMIAIFGQIGGSAGLASESLLYGMLGSHALAISALAATGLIVPLIVVYGFPETARAQLEDISPELALNRSGSKESSSAAD